MSKVASIGKRLSKIVAALTVTTAVVSVPTARALAWGGGGGGGPPPKSQADKDHEEMMRRWNKEVDEHARKQVWDSLERKERAKAIEEQREREKANRQRDNPATQAKEDAQYRPGFAFGPGGAFNVGH